jgi:VWFA-related protein
MGPLAISAAILAVSMAPAQQPAPEAKPVTESVRVNVVNVEVYVTDNRGRPVTDLTATDFEIEEDGRPVALTNFVAARGPVSAKPATLPTFPPSSPATPPSQSPPATAPVAEEQRLNLVVFVDNGNISREGRAAVFEQVSKLLRDGTRPGDRIGLVGFDRSLRESQAFTDQPAVALATLERMAKESAEGTYIATQKSYLNRQMASLDGSALSGRDGFAGGSSTAVMARSLLADIDSFNEQNYQLYRATMDGLIRFVDSLAGLPGRKVLLYVSDGPPLRVGQELYEEFEARFPTVAGPTFNPLMRATRFNLSSYFRDVIHHANAGRVTIYTIDARTDRGLEGRSSENAVMSAVPALGATETMNRDVSMLSFAGGTGGRFLPNTPALGQSLMQAAEDFTAYYSLGYSPTHLGDGKYHRLAVKVRRDGVTVRHREGYLDKPEPLRIADRTSAALLVATDTDALGVRLTFGGGRKEKGKVYQVPLTVTVPAARLVLLDQGATQTGRVSICMAAKDEEGRRAEPQCKSFDISVPAEKIGAWRREEAAFTFEVRLWKGRCRLAVTARDEVALEETTLVREVQVPSGKS